MVPVPGSRMSLFNILQVLQIRLAASGMKLLLFSTGATIKQHEVHPCWFNLFERMPPTQDRWMSLRKTSQPVTKGRNDTIFCVSTVSINFKLAFAVSL